MNSIIDVTREHTHANLSHDRRKRHCGTSFLSLALAALTLPLPVGAQDAGDDAATVLEPIIVTARKREEDVQKIPDSITVLKSDRLQLNPNTTNADIARSVPNFSYVDSGGQNSNQANIRGVGSFSPLSGDDTSVVYYMDEVPLSGYGTPPTLLDVDRVEILRGPQGTLFGRNTQGGAVSIVPNRPDFENSLSINTEVGTDGYAFGQLTANGTIVPDTVAGRLALSWSSFDGDIPNIAAGGKDGGVDVGAARGTLLFAPDAATEALLSFNYGRNESHSPRFLLRDTADFPTSATDPQTDVDSETYGFNFRFKHEFENFVLTSLTSIQRNDSTQTLDMTDGLVFSALTGLPASFFNRSGADTAVIDLGETAYMQEVRFSSLPESEISWTAGTNFYRSEASTDRYANIATPTYYSLNGTQDNDFTTNSYAAFGEVTVPVVDRLKATFGLRATHEDKQASYQFSGDGLPGVVSFHSDSMELSDNALTGRAALSYNWTDSFMTYASVANGHVSAGFPAVAINSYLGKDETSFPASTSWTYEVGFKSELLDQRLTLNGSVFFNDVTNGHLAVFDGTQAMFTVAALDYRSYGGELEATARVAPGFDLFGGIGYTHAELVDVPPDTLTGAASGNRVPNVPELTGNLGLQYRWSAESVRLPGDFVGRVTYQYVGARAANPANSFDLDAYSLVNARLTWENNDRSIYVFANNIFDERYETWGQSFASVQTVRVGQGRVIGVGTSFRF
ncbi:MULTISPECIES: TonB-dependent receptor [unclassified Sinorhizobium]|uniref:TonB-dependent receptor n=1 Tax=unclassified Sinorhizobium TaxID=2613772 RepID=UPI003524A567